MSDLIGQQIKGYTIQELIGEGGFGAVYRAQQQVIDRTVAIKSIWETLASEPRFIRQFEAEAQTVASLEHPYILPLYDYWRDPSGAFLVMRFIRNGNLRRRATTQWRVEEVSKLVSQVASALALAHRYGVVHCDLKPENILIDEAGNAYLGDFGIARLFGGMAEDDVPLGSPAYAAPEQFGGKSPSPQSDQYSLALIVFELLGGQYPFPELENLSFAELVEERRESVLPELKTVRPELPGELNAVIQRATAIDPRDRYPDTIAFAEAFREALLFQVSQQSEAILLQGDAVRTPSGTIRTKTGTPLDQRIIPRALDLVSVVNPYRGLKAFQETDAAVFFGREALREYLLGQLLAGGEHSRFLAIVGPSGSGKSSMVKAGLLPVIRAGEVFHNENLFVLDMVPGSHPMEELEMALLRIAVQAPQNLKEELEGSERGIHRALRMILPDENSELVLLIDQFEETFALCQDKSRQDHFLSSLYTAVVAPHSQLRVIITLRADFYDRPLSHPQFSELMRQRTAVIVPMSAEELERAIVGPAEQVGAVVEPALIAEIIADVVQQPSGALPLFQYTLTELFDWRQEGMLTLAAYQELGGISGALAKRAEELYESLTEAQQAAAKQVLLRLITLGEGTEDTRRRVPLAEVHALGEKEVITNVVDIFGKARLLTFDHDPQTRQPIVEVAHEALIREWQRLRVWLDESREDVRLQRALGVMASDWEKAKREVSFLLRGARLEQYEHWCQATELVLTQTEREYLDAAIAERDRREAAEAARLAREEVLEAQSRHRLRILVGVFAIAAVIAIFLSVFAFGQQREAEDARATSDFNAEAEIAARTTSEAEAARAEREAARAEVEAQRAENQAATAVAAAEAEAAARVEAERSAAEARSLALASNARLARNDNLHELALLLALEANRMDDSLPEAQQVLVDVAYSIGIRRAFTGHMAGVNTFALSPDSRYILTGSGRAIISSYVEDDDNTLRLWELDTGAEIRRFEGHTDTVYSIHFTPDGTRAISGSHDGTMRLWDVATGEQIRLWDLNTEGAAANEIWTTAISPDGQSVASGSVDSVVRLWDMETGAEISRFEGHFGPIIDLYISQDGQQLFSVGMFDNTVRIWDIATGEELQLFNVGAVPFTVSVAVSHDERLIAIANGGGTVKLYDLESGQFLREFSGMSNTPFWGDFSADNEKFLIASLDGSVRLFDVASGEQLRGIEDFFWAAQRVLFLSGDHQAVATSGNAYLLDIEPAGLIPPEIQRNSTIRSMTLTPGGERLVIADRTNTITVADVNTGEIIYSRSLGYRATLSPNGEMVLVTGIGGEGSNGSTVSLWNIERNTIVRRFDFTDETLNGAFVPNSDLVIVTLRIGGAVAWNARTGEEVYRVPDLGDDAFGLAVSAEGIAYGSDRNGAIIAWDATTGEVIHRLNTPPGFILQLSPDEQTLAVGGVGGELVLLDLATGAMRSGFSGHSGTVRGIAWSTDGRFLYTIGDTTLRLWDVMTGLELRRLNFDQTAYGLALIEDGQTAWVGFQDGAIQHWQIPPIELDDLIEWVYENRYLREFTCGERLQYHVEPYCEEEPEATPES